MSRVYGRDLFLSFEDETPKLVDKFSTKRSFVVYDILEILAAPEDKDIKIDPDWEFKVFKDDVTVLLEYDTHSGSRNAASLNHLMSILLNEHLKVIKEEASITLESVGIYITKFSWFTEESEKILKTKFIEIFEEMNVYCEFVEFC
uniref:DUF4279 domain-containing protein n=1 Tax=Panagrolaimus davidi TaxID=227884 RepID=A0A914QMS1_9BILA